MSQIPLPLSFDRQFSLHNYISDNSDYIAQQLVALFDETGEPLIGLCGAGDSGKTHLLNACAHYARECRVNYFLFDAQQLHTANAGHFTDFPAGAVVAIDNLDMLAGSKPWETRCYQLINRVKHLELRMLFSLSRLPRDIGFRLPDLKSRLMWGLMINLQAPDDAALRRIIRARADLLGLKLGDEVLDYLLTHFSRRLADQIDLLNRLDREALSRKRRITIPLVRECCNPPG
jgi:DnaA family protein